MIIIIVNSKNSFIKKIGTKSDNLDWWIIFIISKKNKLNDGILLIHITV